MTTVNVKITPSSTLKNSKVGIWGTLGNGNNCEVHFLQTTLTAGDLDQVKRISDIPESKKWKVKDLFQRNVNNKRIREGIVPYLNDDSKVKFFNPLTLIILPHDSKNKIIKDVPILEDSSFQDFGILFSGKQKSGYYRFGMSDDPFFGKLEWNPNNCFMVAIDGQHRLSALKEIKNDDNNTFVDWKIPVVVLVIHKTNEESTPDLLEIVRRLFVDINEKGEKLSRSRKIILNDSLPVDVVCQEIIELSHSGSGKNILPLNFFDWRGDSDEDQIPVTKLISVEELNGWLTAYFGFSQENAKQPKLPNWLVPLGLPSVKELDYKSTEKLRKFVNEEFVPAFHKFFTSLNFLSKYYAALETQFLNSGFEYFIEREKYGNPQIYDATLEKAYDDFKNKVIEERKKDQNIPTYISTYDIGLRAIAFCFSQFEFFKQLYLVANPTKHSYSWNTHAEYCSEQINRLISKNWLSKEPSQAQDKILQNLMYSTNILNYRLEDIKNGIGSLFLLLSIEYSNVDQTRIEIDTLINNIYDTLQDTYRKDIKKEVKANIEATFSGTKTERAAKTEKETDAKVAQKIKYLKAQLSKI